MSSSLSRGASRTAPHVMTKSASWLEEHQRLQLRTDQLRIEHEALSKKLVPFSQADHDRHRADLHQHQLDLKRHEREKQRGE